MNTGFFRRGLRDGLAIGIGYFSVSFSFGIAAVSSGLTWWQAVVISMTNVTSAGQFAGIGIMAAMGSYIEMAMTQLVINIRYALMSISLAQKLAPDFPLLGKITMGHMITDEVFGVAVSRKGEIHPSYMAGLICLPYIGWALGTLTGAVGGNILPEMVCNALGIMIYGMFLAIIIPVMKKERPVLLVACTAILLSCIIHFVPFFSFITDGFSIIICAVAASLMGAWLFPVKEDDKDEE